MVSFSGSLVYTAPCTKINALDSCWYQTLATQHGQEHRLIYCDRHLDDDEAVHVLQNASGTEAVEAEPKVLSFLSGHRKKFWTGNCIALGLAAGFFEPGTGTSLALLQSGLMRLINMFPDKDCNTLLVDEYNRLTNAEYENIRDFLILHYRATQRGESLFWGDYLAQDVPESLAHKISLFHAQGQVASYEEESFPDSIWASVWLGQDQWPPAYDPVLDNYDFDRLKERFDQMKQLIGQAVEAMPAHRDFL